MIYVDLGVSEGFFEGFTVVRDDLGVGAFLSFPVFDAVGALLWFREDAPRKTMIINDYTILLPFAGILMMVPLNSHSVFFQIVVDSEGLHRSSAGTHGIDKLVWTKKVIIL